MVDIQITDVTTGAINGTGVFDKLMSTVKAHITEQYDKGRIKGQDYATVYLGALQGVLAQSVEYVLREKLTEVQIEAAVKDIELKTAQIDSINIEHVIKDKEATALGLDNVVKNREEARKNNANYVYELAYKGIL